MHPRRHIPVLLACLASSAVAGAWAEARAQDGGANDRTYNPWRTAPREKPAGDSTIEGERGFTQGYLRGFEQGYRRGAEQSGAPATSLGPPTANLGPRPSPGSTGSVLSDGAPAAVMPPAGPAPAATHAAAPAGADAPGAPRSFRPKPSQWGEYPPLDGDRAAPAPRQEAAAPPRIPGPGYPYAPPAVAAAPPAHTAAPTYPPAAYAPYAAPPYSATPYAAPYAVAPYGYGNPAFSGPSTLGQPLGGPYGMGPLPGIPGFVGGPGFGAW